LNYYNFFHIIHYAHPDVAVPEFPAELLAYTVKYAQNPFVLDIDLLKLVPVVEPLAVAIIDPPFVAD
jgi:hypothetical protein